MKSIFTVDPYEFVYEPKTVRYKRYPKHVVEGVDYLVRLSRGRTDVVTSDDWVLVAKIVEFWSRMYPQEWSDYIASMNMIKGTRARKDGYSREKGREGVRYLAAVPERLMRLIKVVFPQQQWNREFTEKFTGNIKVSRVGEKVDTWFSLPDAPNKRKTIDEIVSEELKSKKKKRHGNTKQNTKRS